MIDDPRAFLRELFDAAVARADPARVVADFLPDPPRGRAVVIGAGKASAAMAQAVERAWKHAIEGLVVTRYGHAVPCERIEVIEAGHPEPDAAGREASRRILELVQGLGEDDLVLCLISGGGSALLVDPADGLTLEDKLAVTRSLLKSGATIHEMNAVRKHLSGIKGGRLAARAAPARVVTLAISDVPGDDPSVIASGPTVPDTSTRADAKEVLERFRIDVPERVAAWLESPASETPKPGDARLSRAEFRMVATGQDALEAAAEVARRVGIKPLILSDRIEGEAREVGKIHAAIAQQAARHGQPAAPPCVLLSGGETTVTVRGEGRGGRNAEFLLGLAIALGGAPGIYALACDTDGIDGTGENAGALVTPDTLKRAGGKGMDPSRLLAENDAGGFFERLGDLVVTGPTRTNVNDFRAILVMPDARPGA